MSAVSAHVSYEIVTVCIYMRVRGCGCNFCLHVVLFVVLCAWCDLTSSALKISEEKNVSKSIIPWAYTRVFVGGCAILVFKRTISKDCFQIHTRLERIQHMLHKMWCILGGCAVRVCCINSL